ncbi:dihydropteroate synthase [Sporolactobacillus spathodeae]|uniref:Dihydropteroate synthase n=1 Tax=Sporolactobacillus spathodeae TaxID=1465502 RepID=A0ABS2QBZ3_9BACL|nr:dihydropteroate synthase [Sporolactobacillus spathodeae]MBM7659161.1 dihydropteroate synthase [Sporolactobacillus spathodeae]
MREFERSPYHLLQVRGRTIDYDEKTAVMGILNATPDSFSDGGNYNELTLAVQHALEMEREGADIIDIGGESTRPGYQPVPVEEEIRRVIPIISAIRAHSDIPISIDTYKAETARRALEAGADIINDIWGAKADPEMAHVAAAFDVPIILMHNRDNNQYVDIIEEMTRDLKVSINLALQAGVRPENIILDPGIGFAKDYDQNLYVMNHLEAFHELGYPILLGTSRKGFIGRTLNLSADQRVEGTGATVCLGMTKGCQIMRVHDVLEIARMTKMMDTMLQVN